MRLVMPFALASCSVMWLLRWCTLMSLRSPPRARIASPSWCHKSPFVQPSPVVSSRRAAQPRQ
eukprot:9087581-Pyramimonas_sp.AAC.1